MILPSPIYKPVKGWGGTGTKYYLFHGCQFPFFLKSWPVCALCRIRNRWFTMSPPVSSSYEARERIWWFVISFDTKAGEEVIVKLLFHRSATTGQRTIWRNLPDSLMNWKRWEALWEKELENISTAVTVNEKNILYVGLSCGVLHPFIFQDVTAVWGLW